MDDERKTIIAKRLETMIELAEKLSCAENEGKFSTSDLAGAKNGYIRIRGEDYRAVSLADKSPLCGFTKKKGADDIDTLLTHFKEPREPVGGVIANKKERQMQSFIIKKALRNGRSLKKALGLNSGLNCFDELLFALDEVSLGDSIRQPVRRCDILAVGSHKGRFFPVLIELKYGREKTNLEKQLEEFCVDMEAHEESFRKLLEACTGKELSTWEPIRKMIIWPKAKEGRERADTLSDLRKKDISVVEYVIEGENITFEERQICINKELSASQLKL